jgi:hypothetical protein
MCIHVVNEGIKVHEKLSDVHDALILWISDNPLQLLHKLGLNLEDIQV